MGAFIKSFDLKNIRRKLVILYILDVLDIAFTLVLLDTGLFTEANSFMALVVRSPLLAVLLKTILPGFLFIYLYFGMQTATERQLRYSNTILNFALAAYGGMNFMHLFWLSILPLMAGGI